MSAKTLYRIGSYLLFPLLAAIGGWILARARSPALAIFGFLFLLATLAVPAVLGRVCRSCGHGFWASLGRLLILPTVLVVALIFRTAAGPKQILGLVFLGLSSILFSLGWQLTARRNHAPQGDRPPPSSR